MLFLCLRKPELETDSSNQSVLEIEELNRTSSFLAALDEPEAPENEGSCIEIKNTWKLLVTRRMLIL